MIKQLIINDKKSYDDFGLFIGTRNISSPKKKSIKESVPFSNVVYDFSNINGEIYWEERTLQYTFDIAELTTEEMESVKSKVLDWLLNVHDTDIYDPYIGNYHFHGSFDSNSWVEDFGAGTITISFTVYPYKISNDDINVIEEIGFSDTGTLESSVDSELVGLKIDGKSTQETTTENLFDNTWEQGAIDISTGNMVSHSSSVRTANFLKVYPNYLYEISRTVSTSYMVFRFYDKDKNYLGSQEIEGMITSSTSSGRMGPNIFSMTFTITNVDVAYMKIGDNSNDLTTIYTLTTNCPSPDYPSEIKSVGYTNLFNGWKIGEKISDSTGQVVSSITGATAIDYIPVDFEKNPNYYLSGLTDKLFSFVSAYDKDKNFLGRTGANGKSYYFLNENSFTAHHVDGIIAYLQVTIYENSNISGTIDIVNNLNTMLNVGNIAKNYIPYKKYGVEVETIGANFLNISDTTYTSNGVTTTIANGVMSSNGTMTTNFFDMIPVCYFDKELPIGTYTFSIDKPMSNSELHIRLLGDDNEYYTIKKNQKSVTFTTNEIKKRFRIFGTASTNTAIDFTIKPQLEAGNEATPFENYKKTTTLIQLDEPLRSLPNGVKDTYENGVVTRRVAEDDVTIIDSTTLPNGNKTGICIISNKNQNNNISTNSILSSQAEVSDTFEENTCYENPANIVFVGNPTDTLETMKEKYDGCKLLYELATPVIENYDKPSIPTYENTTNIFLSEDTTFEVKYNEKITKTIINNSSHRITPTIISGGNFTITKFNNSSKNLLNVPSSYELTGAELGKSIFLKAGTYKITNSSIVTNGTSSKHLIMFKGANGESKALYLIDNEEITLTVDFDVTSYNIYSQNNYNNSEKVTTIFNNLMISVDGGLYEPYKGIESSYSIGKGVYKSGLYFAAGENNLIITGCGKITFSYVEEVF